MLHPPPVRECPRAAGLPWLVEDGPAWGYRGLLVDCARHKLSIPFLKQVIGPTDTMDTVVLLEAALGILQHAITEAQHENEQAVKRKREASGQSDAQGKTVERWRNAHSAVESLKRKLKARASN